MIIVIGSNPSQKSPDKSAFSDTTRSGKTVRGWFLGVPDVIYINVSDEPTDGNRPLTNAEVRSALPALKAKLAGATRIITVGKTAQFACRILGLSFLSVPHPSGRCRTWNDPAARIENKKLLDAYVR